MRDAISSIKILRDQKERDRKIQQLIEDSIEYANEIVGSGDYFEAGEFLYTAAELLEEVNSSHSSKLYKFSIKLWENQISTYKIQARLHEIAEIYLRIAEIYAEKLQDSKSERKNILNSISFLKQESKLLHEFDETRKFTQNYQNIAELFFKIKYFKKAIKYYDFAIDLSKEFQYFDLLSYSYQQISYCYKELDEFDKAKNIIFEGIKYFKELYKQFEGDNDNLTIAQICQVLKKLYQSVDNMDQFINYSKKEAGAYINLAESLEKNQENFQKIARYYRGAGLCYQEINNNLIESASCFLLAGNYSEKIEEFDDAAINFFNAAITFKELSNLEMAYKHYVKAGDNYWKTGNVIDSTESYLYAYDIAIEGGLEFNEFGIFNQIVRGLNIIAKEGLKNKEFYTAATLILESIKFYQQLDTAKDFLLNEMINNLYKYYYKAANLKKIGSSHIVQSYVLAAISSILNGKIQKAQKIISEIESEGYTVDKYKEIVNQIIEWVSQGKNVEFQDFPYRLQRIIEGSEEIMYLLKLFRGFKITA